MKSLSLTSTSKKDRPIPNADSVQWLGLCPCGCGDYKIALLDRRENAIAVFGFDREGWMEFTARVLRCINEEPCICDHTTH